MLNNEHRQVHSAFFNEKLVPVFRLYKTVHPESEDFHWPAFELIPTVWRGSISLLFPIWRCFNWKIQLVCHPVQELLVPPSDLVCHNVKEITTGSRLPITDSNQLLTCNRTERSKVIIQANYLSKIQLKKARLLQNDTLTSMFMSIDFLKLVNFGFCLFSVTGLQPM